MNRRTLIGVATASAALSLLNRVASAQTSLKTRNVVFVHGLFADGSCWSKVSHHRNGITDPESLQQTSATKSAISRQAALQ